MSNYWNNEAPVEPLALPNPLGIHCVECTVWDPCGPCQGQIEAEATWLADQLQEYLAAKLLAFLATGERCSRLAYEVGVEDHGTCRVCTLPGICHEV